MVICIICGGFCWLNVGMDELLHDKDHYIAPKFSKLIEDVMVNENDEVSFKCSISEGYPTPVVKWYKNSMEITDTQGITVKKFRIYDPQNLKQFFLQSLHFFNVSRFYQVVMITSLKS